MAKYQNIVLNGKDYFINCDGSISVRTFRKTWDGYKTVYQTIPTNGPTAKKIKEISAH